MLRCISLVLALALYASTVTAQTPPVNPTEYAFDSPDHAIVTDYEIGWFLAGQTVPVQTTKLPKPALNADGSVHLTASSRPLTLGQYEVKVRPYVGTTVGPWGAGGAAGDQPVPFSRALSSISNLRVVR